MTKFLAKGKPAVHQQPSVWRLLVDVSAPVPGGLEDWPAEVADPILSAIEKQCPCRAGWEARVVFSACLRNYDVAEFLPGAYYLDVQVGEFPTEETMHQWKEGRLR